MTMATLISIDGLRKSFGGLEVLKGLSFAVPEGGMRVLIGPNGCGKSTLLKTIIGIHKPDGGAIALGEKPLAHLLPHQISRLGVSTKLQVPSVYRDLSVRQNLRIATQRHYRSNSGDLSAAIAETLETTGLADVADSPAGILSHGHQQWLEIGMAVATRPRLLLLDEPTAGMTAEETQLTVRLIGRLNREWGMGVIIVEHDMHFVSELEAPCLVINEGQVFFEGMLADVRANPEVREIYFGSRA